MTKAEYEAELKRLGIEYPVGVLKMCKLPNGIIVSQDGGETRREKLAYLKTLLEKKKP